MHVLKEKLYIFIQISLRLESIAKSILVWIKFNNKLYNAIWRH